MPSGRTNLSPWADQAPSQAARRWAIYTLPPRPFLGRKADATPEQWAAHLAYRRQYVTTDAFKARRRAAYDPEKERARRQTCADQTKESQKKYRAAHKAEAADKRREYRKKSPKDREAQKQRYRNLTPAKKADRQAKRREWERKRMRECPQYAAAKSIRCRMYLALKRGWKSGSTVELLGCDVSQCIEYIASQWLPGMTWGNWGMGKDNTTWHIDHIKPVTAFDLTTAEGQKAAFHYTNLRPMWGSDNIRKGGAGCTQPQT